MRSIGHKTQTFAKMILTVFATNCIVYVPFAFINGNKRCFVLHGAQYASTKKFVRTMPA